MCTGPRVAHTLSCMLVLFATVYSIPIDNEVVGDPEIECGSETITVSFKARNPYNGKMFVKGFAHEEESCVKHGQGLEQESFMLRFDQCGVKRSREINGVSVSATVIISFHKIFLTKVDRAYRVSCFYMEAEKSVSQELEVSMLTTRLIEKQTEMPVCRYEILRGGISGAPVSYARIGEPVYHKWTCEAKVDDQYCMRVHSCNVDDGQGGTRVPVLDENGCEVDHFILQNLEYATDLMAGQEAHVFKFADKPALYFNCQIELRIKDSVTGCSLVQPSCGGGASPSASPHPPDETNVPYEPIELTSTELSSIEVSSVEQSQTTTPILPPTGTPVEQLTQGTSTEAPTEQEQTTSEEQPYPPPRGEQSPSPLPPSPSPSQNPYRHRKTQRHRRAVVQPDLIADFDLPEQQIMVFGLEDAPPPALATNERESLLPFHNDGNLRTYLSKSEGSVCLSAERFAGMAIALLGMSVLSVALVLVGFARRHVLYEALMNKAKQ